MQGPNIWPWAKEIYLGATPTDNPEVSPLFGEWYGLPPMHFHVSDTEIILDDSTRATERAKLAGCDVVLSVWHDVPHNFPFIDYLVEARNCRTEIVAFIERVTARGKHIAASTTDDADSLLTTEARPRRSA